MRFVLNFIKKFFKWLGIALAVLTVVLILLSIRTIPEKITYGVSFSKLHAEELHLNWKEAYIAVLDDLKVRHFRLSAHWTEIEPAHNNFNFSDFDFQIKEAQKRGADVILAVGRRLPGWPECHNPQWFNDLPNDQKEPELMQYVAAVVNRYKNYSAVKYWQVENEAFLTVFARHSCGDFLNEDLLQKEIALVRKLDPSRKIVLTDSGELGLWYKAYRNADVFGTSVYLYVWNHYFGQIRYPITPGFFRIKANIMTLMYGHKETLLSELSAEPWLLKPIIDTSIDDQFKNMSFDRFNNTIEFGKRTGFDKQLLWGAEWWYWLTKNGHPEFWNRAKELFK